MTHEARVYSKRLKFRLAVLFLVCTFLIPVSAQADRYGNWHMGQWMMGGWGAGWFGMIFMVIFWGLVIAGIVFLVRWLLQSTSGRDRTGVCTTGSRALHILEERYARGELSRDEFESMKGDILK